MLKNKLSKFLVSVFALAIVFGALVFVSSGKVLADGDDGYIPDGFVLDEEDGWYKKSIGGMNYKLLNQNIIDNKCSGGLPNDGVFSMGNADAFYVAEDLTITKGISVDNGYSIHIELNGFTISYEPENTDEYFYRATPDEDKTYGCSLFIVSSGSRGTIKTPKGAPLFIVGSCNVNRICSVSLYDVILEGNAQAYDPNGYRAITITKNGDATLQNTTIKNFSAQKGGAIYCEAFSYIHPYGGDLIYREELDLGYHSEFINCFADEGGAVYSEVSVDCMSSTLSNNTAQSRGGAICVMGSENTVDLGDCTITNNTCVASASATTGGGAIYCGSINTSVYAVNAGWSPEARVIDNTCGNNVTNNIYFPHSSRFDMVFFENNYDDNPDFTIGISRYSYSGMDLVAYADDIYTFSNATIPQVVFDEPGYEMIGWEKQTIRGVDYYRYLRIVKVNGDDSPIFLKGFSLLFHEYELKIKMSVYVPDLENYSSSDWSAELKAEEGSRFYVTKGALECEEVSFGNNVIFFTFTYDPTDMTVPLSFTVLRDNEQIITAGGFTVQDYALAILKNPLKYNEGDADIAATLVNYGACSQKYFKFRESDLADSILNDYPDLKEKIDNYDMETRFFDHDITFGITNRDGDITLYSMSAIFGGSPSVKLYFKVKDGVDPVFLYYDYDIDGYNQYTAKNRGNGVYTVTIPGRSLSYYAFDSSKLPDQPDFSSCYLNSSSTADLYLVNYLSYMYKNGSTAEMRELAKGLLVFQDVVITKTL